MRQVKLKNGSKVPDMLLDATMRSLEGMINANQDDTSFLQGVSALYDLYQICAGKNYDPSDRNLQYLIDRSLLQASGGPHSSIRNIVLSAVVVEGVEGDESVYLVSPLAD